MMNKFEIKAYKRGELGLLYHPGVSENAKANALRWLYRQIAANRKLCEALRPTGYFENKHEFTPLQVSLIVSFLGPPYGHMD